jgi:gluconate 2-dehydrogenase gamma chain
VSGLKRRAFLAGAGLAAAGCREGEPWRVLSDGEAATLGAVVDCLIPEDDDPGARIAGVVQFIDTQLTKRYRARRADYRRWLAAFGNFAEQAPEEQHRRMAELEGGRGDKTAWGPDGGRGAFNTILAHTYQGFFGNPRHGGNRDYVSWRMLGVPATMVRGREK